MSETTIVFELGDLSLIDSKLNTNEMDSKTQSELLKSMKLIGYEGSLLSSNDLSNALAGGPKNVEYTKLISFLTNEIRELYSLDECVNAITTAEDSNTFLMETSSFLKELGCPHEHLVQGHVSDRLGRVEDRALLIQHLVTELMAARIIRENNPEKRMDLKLEESLQASDLRKILQILGFAIPPKNITMKTLIEKITACVQSLLAKANKDLINNPIFNGTLSEKQWETLAQIDRDLHDEYLIRREMLLKRLDCTIQSFQWSDKTKGKDNIFDQMYSEKRKCLTTEPDVDVSDLLASRDDVAIIEKTSNASVRKNTKSSVNRVIIGAVPDRGGRTSEQAPPPPEMPPWQQRNAGPSMGGGGGGGGRGGFNRGGQNFSRGGGNFSQSNNNYSNSSSSFNKGGSNFNKGTSYSQGSYNSYSDTKQSFDSAGSYSTDVSRIKSEYSSQGGGIGYSKGQGDDSSRGYSQGYSRDTKSSFSQSSGNYSRDNSSSYSQSSGNYQRDSGNPYSRDSGNYSQGYARDNNSSYSQSSGNYRDTGNSYSKDSTNYSQGYSRDNSSYSQTSGSNSYSKDSGSYSQGNYTKPFDSAGSYGGRYSQDYQEPKRAKTYDQFQPNKSTYADQYVQESEHNMQYQSRDRDNRNQRQGGRSNYNRGGGRGSYR